MACYLALIGVGRIIMGLVIYPGLKKHHVEFSRGGLSDYVSLVRYWNRCMDDWKSYVSWYVVVLCMCLLHVLAVPIIVIWARNFGGH